jgi:hypothetical protein
MEEAEEEGSFFLKKNGNRKGYFPETLLGHGHSNSDVKC